MEKHMNIPVFIPHLGCKNDCVFCNQRSITGTLGEVSCDEVRGIIEEHLRFAQERQVEIAFFGGSFTGLDIQKQENYLSVAYEYVKSGDVSGIRLSTRPDYISIGILDMLSTYGVKTIELGAQSMCDDVLLKSGRGHRVQHTRESAALIKAKGFSLGLQMMLGLPGDTHEKSLYTAREICAMGADNTRIYPTVVLKHTCLYDMYMRGEYTPLTVEQAVETAKEAVKIFDSSGVNILRIGLQQSETLGSEVAAGAYHPAMGELVLSRLVRDDAESYITEHKAKEIIITADRKNISVAVGQNRCNIKYLEEKYSVPVKVKTDTRAGIYIQNTPLGRKRKDETK
ncbi:MAG: radical SAM protein [Clostridia bacterium]|nr:radical SAM protein [Clostridia bacterium]